MCVLNRKSICVVLSLLLACSITLFGCSRKETKITALSIADIPPYAGDPYVVINNNEPNFTKSDKKFSGEMYSQLDHLGRCGYAMALVGESTMPMEERGQIGQIKPSGWQTVKYDFVDGKYLYNRCHLIGYQLTGENANQKNLITGTRYMNVQGMLPFENMVADYVKETGNHVLYRVTPIYDGKNLLASGVEMEAYSLEDDGEGILFHVFVYNVQPGVEINYATGESKADESQFTGEIKTYILNKNSKKFHETNCKSVSKINEENKEEYKGTRDAIVNQGYTPCGECKP